MDFKIAKDHGVGLLSEFSSVGQIDLTELKGISSFEKAKEGDLSFSVI